MALKVPKLFVPVDVDLDLDPYIAAGGPWAELLWIRCLRWSKKRPELRGFIPATAVDWIGQGIRQPAKKLDDLLATPLPMHEGCTKPPLLSREGGWQIRSWDAWNQTPEEQERVRQRFRRGALLTNHKAGYHKETPEEDCPKCQANQRYSDRRGDRPSDRPSGRHSHAEEEGTSYGGSSSRTVGPEGGRRRSDADWPRYPDDWRRDDFRPRDYLLDSAHLEEGGWDGGAWIQPSVWRQGWNAMGMRPAREGDAA